MKTKVTPKRSQQNSRPQRAALAPAVPIRTVLFGGAALLILFAWLHLILALQIASTGRQIQITTEELHKLRRDNAAVVRETALVESEERMAERAAAMGYGPQAPVYVSLGQTLTTTGAAIGSADSHDSSRQVASDRQYTTLSRFLLDRTLYDTTSAQGQATGSFRSEP